jgi:hypothetical protein
MYFKMSSAHSTKNTKENRCFIHAFYTNSEYECAYELPDGVDVEDPTQVVKYWVKWGILYIQYTEPNERTKLPDCVEQIEPSMDYQPENKWADEVSVHRVEDYEDIFTCLPIEDLYADDDN